MLAPTSKTKRLLETIQVVLTFTSVCTVVDTSFVEARPHGGPGYYAGGPQQTEARGDRSVSDLARTERKRREVAFREALQQR